MFQCSSPIESLGLSNYLNHLKQAQYKKSPNQHVWISLTCHEFLKTEKDKRTQLFHPHEKIYRCNDNTALRNKKKYD